MIFNIIEAIKLKAKYDKACLEVKLWLDIFNEAVDKAANLEEFMIEVAAPCVNAERSLVRAERYMQEFQKIELID